MKTAVVPVVIYTRGERRIVGEAVVDIDDYDGINIRTAEIDLNNAGLSEMREGAYSLA